MNSSVGSPGTVSCKGFAPGLEAALGDCFPHFFHDLQVKMQVVQCIQSRTGDFIRPLQVMQIRAREVATSVALATGVQWPRVVAVPGVADLDIAVAGEQPTIAGVTC